jgi:hypothetical protein
MVGLFQRPPATGRHRQHKTHNIFSAARSGLVDRRAWALLAIERAHIAWKDM